MNRPAVFFDRDNTLIANDGYLGDPGGVVLISGAARAIARARAMGFAVVTISNQSGVARGLFPETSIHAVNSRMDEMLLDQHPNARIDRHEFCPYHPEAAVERYKRDSELRKPKPGMILQAAERLNLDLPSSWVVGDAPRDIEAGKAAGCRTILFTDATLKPSSATTEASTVAPDFSATSLAEALDIIEQNKMSNAQSKQAEQGQDSKSEAPAEAQGESESPPAAEVVSEPDPAPVDSTPAKQEEAEVHAETSEPRPIVAPVAETPEPEIEKPEVQPAGPPKRMTFAERVLARHIQPARDASGAGVATAEKPKRAIPAAGEAAAPPAHCAAHDPNATAETIVKATEPVGATELLEPLLQQLLEEVRLMRQQQQPVTEFAVSKLLAGIVQVLVLPALFFAYLHRSDGDLPSMLLLATFLQTLTIALLIMGRQQ